MYYFCLFSYRISHLAVFCIKKTYTPGLYTATFIVTPFTLY
ncbi:HXXEE domain-containing protein [Alkalihalobacterium bogoriense]